MKKTNEKYITIRKLKSNDSTLQLFPSPPSTERSSTRKWL